VEHQSAAGTGFGLATDIRLISLGLEHFRNYCGLIKIARIGFPWQKTTKGAFASVHTNVKPLSPGNSRLLTKLPGLATRPATALALGDGSDGQNVRPARR
jgi:hypothetical protein